MVNSKSQEFDLWYQAAVWLPQFMNQSACLFALFFTAWSVVLGFDNKTSFCLAKWSMIWNLCFSNSSCPGTHALNSEVFAIHFWIDQRYDLFSHKSTLSDIRSRIYVINHQFSLKRQRTRMRRKRNISNQFESSACYRKLRHENVYSKENDGDESKKEANTNMPTLE